MLGDIRCGCGGLCDSGELCNMRSHVEPCGCGVGPVHGLSQHSFVVDGDVWVERVSAQVIAAASEVMAAHLARVKSVGRCPACGQLQDTASCSRREHYLPPMGR